MKKLNRYELARQFNVHEDVVRSVCVYYSEDEKTVIDCLSSKEKYLKICRLQKYKKNLSLEDFEIIKNLSDKDAREFMRKKSLEKKYGTLDEFYKNKDIKRRETLIKKYGRSNSFDTQKSKETKLERYGDENYNNRKKAKETCLEKYNVENVFLSTNVKEQSKETKLEKYGDINYNNREKAKETKLERYGDENYNNLSQIKETKLEKYRDENYTNREKAKETIQNFSIEKKECIKEKTKQTIIEKYQTLENYNKIILEKAKQTKLEKYGDENYSNHNQASLTLKSFSKSKKEEIQNKRKNTLLNKFGENYQNILNARKINTCLEKYGVENPMQNEIVKERARRNQNSLYGEHREKILTKIKKTNIEKYGVPYIFQSPNFIKTYPGHITKPELEIQDFLKSLNVKFDTSCRNIISTPEHLLELDIYVPEKKVAIEYNGLYWHSEYFKPNNYHMLKSDLCREKDIRLIHIFSDQWDQKKDICKSIIKSALGIYDERLYARKCKVLDIDNTTYENFLLKNHIQGIVHSSIKKGLFYNGELIQVIGVGKSRFKKDEYELHRMCSKLNTQVLGGFSKLLKSLDIKELTTYVDLSLFNGKGYDTVGFEFIKKNPPNYWYLDKGCNKRLSRQSCQKHKLKALLKESFDEKLTEVENMHKASYFRIFDSGNIKLLWKNPKLVP